MFHLNLFMAFGFFESKYALGRRNMWDSYTFSMNFISKGQYEIFGVDMVSRAGPQKTPKKINKKANNQSIKPSFQYFDYLLENMTYLRWAWCLERYQKPQRK